MTNKKFEFGDVLLSAITILCVLFVVGYFIFMGVQGIISNEKNYNFCEENYPPKINNSSYREITVITKNIEDGYVKCCRSYWEEHEKKEECKIFKK